MSDEFERAFAGGAKPSFVEKISARQSHAVEGSSLSNPSVYKAFGFLPTNGISETCDVQRWQEGTGNPEGIEFQYRFLLQTAYTADTEIRLYLPDIIIIIAGRHLTELRKKIARRQVTFVVQFNDKLWSEKPDLSEPLIEAISVVRPD